AAVVALVPLEVHPSLARAQLEDLLHRCGDLGPADQILAHDASLAALSSSAGSIGSMRTRATRRPSSSLTVSRCPSASTASPTRGTCPRLAITKPASVSYGPPGTRPPACPLTSSRLSNPSASTSLPAMR